MNIKTVLEALGLTFSPWVNKKSNQIKAITDLCCPVCGNDCNFVMSPPILENGDDNYQAEWWGRGDLIRIPIHSNDCNHSWEVCYGFHKGSVTRFIRIVNLEQKPIDPCVNCHDTLRCEYCAIMQSKIVLKE